MSEINNLKDLNLNLEQKYLIVNCPHCLDPIYILKKDLKCKIFRHAVYKKNPKKQINPHATQEECEKLIKNNKVFGCAKPFRINDNFQAEICDFI